MGRTLRVGEHVYDHLTQRLAEVVLVAGNGVELARPGLRWRAEGLELAALEKLERPSSLIVCFESERPAEVLRALPVAERALALARGLRTGPRLEAGVVRPISPEELVNEHAALAGASATFAREVAKVRLAGLTLGRQGFVVEREGLREPFSDPRTLLRRGEGRDKSYSAGEQEVVLFLVREIRRLRWNRGDVPAAVAEARLATFRTALRYVFLRSVERQAGRKLYRRVSDARGLVSWERTRRYEDEATLVDEVFDSFERFLGATTTTTTTAAEDVPPAVERLANALGHPASLERGRRPAQLVRRALFAVLDRFRYRLVSFGGEERPTLEWRGPEGEERGADDVSEDESFRAGEDDDRPCPASFVLELTRALAIHRETRPPLFVALLLQLHARLPRVVAAAAAGMNENTLRSLFPTTGGDLAAVDASVRPLFERLAGLAAQGIAAGTCFDALRRALLPTRAELEALAGPHQDALRFLYLEASPGKRGTWRKDTLRLAAEKSGVTLEDLVPRVVLPFVRRLFVARERGSA